MSDWTIQIPFRSRSDSLSDVANARLLPGTDEDRETVLNLVLQARLDGLATAGDLLNRLDAMAPGQRRQLLDRARAEAGLESTGEADARKQREVHAPPGNPGCKCAMPMAARSSRPPTTASSRRWT